MIIILFIIFAILIATNFTPDTYLSIWDTIHSEFNFSLDIKRNIFAVWQEYRGLGLVDGMAHAADLPRQMFLWIFSIFLPQNTISYFFHFFILGFGSLGVYLLLSHIILRDEKKNKREMGSILGALFYLLNFGTVQYFYVPFEAFSVLWGMFPWFIFVLLNYLKKPCRKNLLCFILVNFISIPAFYIQTNFLIYISTILIISGIYLFRNKSFKTLKQILILSFALVIINTYWLLPSLYFLKNDSHFPREGMNNLMSTEDTYLQNKRRGNVNDLLLLRGYYYDFVEDQRYLMQGWRNHFENKYVLYLSYGLSLIWILGFLKRNENKKYLVGIFGFSAFALLSNTFPISSMQEFLRNSSGFWDQVFRSPFTKFIVPEIFCISIFFAFGSLLILGWLEKKIARIGTLFFIVSIILLIIYSRPLYYGNLFNSFASVNIPSDYFELFSFFNKQNQSERVVLLPQFSYWGWIYYKWGYKGSGIVWQGIKQPVLDRAFDVWNSNNENYYWEISQAIYSKNLDQLEKIFEKYQVSWLILDDNVVGFSNTKSLSFTEIKELLQLSRKVYLVQQFGKISVYHVNTEIRPKNFVFLSNSLVNIGPEYKWNNLDQAYSDYGNYITDNRQQITSNRQPFDTERSRSAQGKQIADYNETIKQSSNDGLLSGRAGLLVKSDVHKKNSDSQEKSNYHKADIDIKKEIVAHSSSDNLSIFIAKTKNTIAKITSYVNKTIDQMLTGNKFGESTINPIYPADKLVNKPEITRTPDFVNTSLIRPIHAQDITENSNLAIGQSSSRAEIYYPFRSLFTGRKQEELEFGVFDFGTYFSFKAKIPKDMEGSKLVIPKSGNEIFDVGEINLDSIVSKDPQIFLDGEVVQIPSPLHLAGVMASQVQPATPEVKINSEVSLTLPYIKEGNLEVRVPKVGGLYSYDSNITYDVFENVPKTCDQFNKGLFSQETVVENKTKLLKLTSVGSSNCLDIDLGHLAQRYGYLLTVESKNLEGKSLLISVINKNSQRSDLETYLPSRHSGDSERSVEDFRIDSGQARMTTSFFILPPMEPDAIGYTLHLDNTSIGRVKTVNYLGKITVNPIPYKFLTSLKIVTDSSTFKGETLKGDIKVDHPNPSFYKVDLASDSTLTPNTYMVLSQSFDKGWKAYEISCQLSVVSCQLQKILPFLFAKEIKNHVLINNWENGWDLSSTSYNLQPVTIIIVYLPQYLEYIGFGLLLILLAFLFLTRKKKYFHGIKID